MKCSFEHAIANEVLEVYRAYFGSIAKFMQCVVSNITFPILQACKTNFAKNRLYHASGSCKVNKSTLLCIICNRVMRLDTFECSIGGNKI